MKKTAENHVSTAVIDGYDYDEDIAEAACHVGTGTIFNFCAVIGVWSLACLGSAVIQYGVIDILKGWLCAISCS
ncbi:MAG: hypothetical protein M0P70_00910 [Desulfobulbaceae bacterium]|nr:hypothetical protein [Desulfobulbaceae bacterium]